jgi:hypothetical protein
MCRIDFAQHPCRVTPARDAGTPPLHDHRSELPHPAPYSLIGDVEFTLGEQVLHISVTQGEAQLKPDDSFDDNRRKVAGGGMRFQPSHQANRNLTPEPTGYPADRSSVDPLSVLPIEVTKN